MWNHHLSAFARHTKRTKIIKGRDQIHLHITITFPIAQKKEKSGDPVSGCGWRCPVLKSTQIHFAGLRFSTLGGGVRLRWAAVTGVSPPAAEHPLTRRVRSAAGLRPRLPCLAVSTPKSDGSLPNVSWTPNAVISVSFKEILTIQYLASMDKVKRWPFECLYVWIIWLNHVFVLFVLFLWPSLVVFPFSDRAQPIQFLCLKGRVDWYGCRQEVEMKPKWSASKAWGALKPKWVGSKRSKSTKSWQTAQLKLAGSTVLKSKSFKAKQ